MKNLENDNILCDDGRIGMEKVRELEERLKISLPAGYANFIIKHNGASIISRCFNFYDKSIQKENTDSIAFTKFEKIYDKIQRLRRANENFPEYGEAFEDGLIPFGDNGGGDSICFDYRKDKTTNNPPVVIWNHDMGLKHRVVFIANNFEEFINMLYEPED